MLSKKNFILVLFFGFSDYFLSMQDVGFYEYDLAEQEDALVRDILSQGRRLFAKKNIHALYKYFQQQKFWEARPDFNDSLRGFLEQICSKKLNEMLICMVFYCVFRPGEATEEKSAAYNVGFLLEGLLDDELESIKLISSQCARNFVLPVNKDNVKLYKNRFGKLHELVLSEQRNRIACMAMEAEYSSRTSSESSAPPPDSQ